MGEQTKRDYRYKLVVSSRIRSWHPRCWMLGWMTPDWMAPDWMTPDWKLLGWKLLGYWRLKSFQTLATKRGLRIHHSPTGRQPR